MQQHNFTFAAADMRSEGFMQQQDQLALDDRVNSVLLELQVYEAANSRVKFVAAKPTPSFRLQT